MDVHTDLFTGSDVDRILCLCWGSCCCSIVCCEVALFVAFILVFGVVDTILLLEFILAWRAIGTFLKALRQFFSVEVWKQGFALGCGWHHALLFIYLFLPLYLLLVNAHVPWFCSSLPLFVLFFFLTFSPFSLFCCGHYFNRAAGINLSTWCCWNYLL